MEKVLRGLVANGGLIPSFIRSKTYFGNQETHVFFPSDIVLNTYGFWLLRPRLVMPEDLPKIHRECPPFYFASLIIIFLVVPLLLRRM